MGKYGTLVDGNRKENLNKAQTGTANDLKEMLRKHEIALMIRPTGFGKTYTMVKLCEMEKYKKILYLYPMDVIRQSIIDDYHDHCYKPGIGKVEDKSGRKFNLNEAEAKERPDLPLMIFVSYAKMLRDWREAYKYYPDYYYKLSGSEQVRIVEAWNKPDEERDKADTEWKLKVQKSYLKQRLKDVDLLIIDEAHMVGAEGFMEYWPYIKKMFMGANKIKESRLHVVGATATPLRTATDVDIEKEVFYYTYGGKKVSARIRDFTIIDCWKANILPRPYHTKGVVDKSKELSTILAKLEATTGGTTTIGRDTEKASAVKIVNNPYLNRKEAEYKKKCEAIKAKFEDIKEPSEIIRNAIEAVKPGAIQSGEYMRFLVFYQDTKELIENSQIINKAFEEALANELANNTYKGLNIKCIVSNEKLAKQANLPLQSIEELSARTKELEKVNYQVNEIDIIHSIDKLNMGYHVGVVTGVVICRSTGSEIKYYQQLGRCMSVKGDNRPLIIDFDNADSALFIRTQDTLRKEATARIKEFTRECDKSPEANLLNSIYSEVRMSISLAEMPDDILEYFYFDRMAPVYFIKGIALAKKCNEGIDSLVEKIYNIAYKNDKYSIDDVVDDNYTIKEPRIPAKAKRVLIKQVEEAVRRIKQEKGGIEDA